MKFFKSSLWKDTNRTIKNSLARYLAIIAMTSLSAMVFIGLSSGVPNMRAMIENRVNDHNFHDVKVSSYAGLREKDRDILNNLDGDNIIEYRSSEIFSVKDENYDINVFQNTDKIDTYIVREGRLPEKNNEIALDYLHYKEHGDQIGKEINFVNKVDDKDKELLSIENFTIVGYVDSVEYISTSRNTGVSGGAYFAVVNQGALHKEFPDAALLVLSNLENYDIKTNEYRLKETEIVDQIADAFEARPIEVEKSIKNEVNQEIADARLEIEDGKKELESASEDLLDAESELEEAEKELENAATDIENAEIEISDGQATLNQEISDARNEVNEGQDQLDEAQVELDQAIEKYYSGLDEFNREINSAQAQIDKAREELDQANTELNNRIEQYNQGLAQYNQIIESGAYDQLVQGINEIDAQINQIESLPVIPEDMQLILTQLKEQRESLVVQRDEIDQTLVSLQDAESRIEEGRIQYRAGVEEANRGQEELNTRAEQGRSELDDAWKEIEEGQAEINANRIRLNEAMAQIDDEQIDGQAELDQARQDLESGRQDYQEGLNDYQEGLEEYESGKEEFEEEEKKALADIEQAEKDIEEAESDIENIKIPLYSIEGKYDDTTFFSILSQADSLKSLAIIFTSLFYLVSILVTLTTLLRMVEVERTQIGTLKALGYSRKDILVKYLMYGLSATVIGSILGIVIGYYVLMPPVITAYVSSTDLSNNPMIFEWDMAALIFIISIIIIALTVILSVGKSLREKAAYLMRPKPPKKASRTVFERIPFLWNNLSFLNKVSIRNVMRSKVRMFMTILGVSGSFSLIAMAFGIQGSISTVGDKQFNDVYQFDAQLVYQDTADDFDDLNMFLEEDASSYMDVLMTQGKVTNTDGMKEDVTFMAVEDLSKFDEFIKLKSIDKHEKLNFSDNKVILSEKLSRSMDLKSGDFITFQDPNGGEQEIEVQNITEQYFGHQIYMTKSSYNKFIDDTETNNTYLIKFDDMTDDEIETYDSKLSEIEAVASYIPNLELKDTLEELSDSLKIVIVLVVILSAMLTFVVLYNLTNINISERLREIATIKVLGFRSSEVVSYIFKENYILTFIGMLVGIVLAKIMHNIIVYELSPAAFLFDPYLNPISYLYAAIIVMVFTILVMFMAKKNMSDIDMVDALGQVE